MRESFWKAIRLTVVVAFIVAAFWWVAHTKVDPLRSPLFVSVATVAVTLLYALLTYEILLENKSMARAAVDSSKVMERSLRFSYAPKLLFRTISTKDPTFGAALRKIKPVENADYQRAMASYQPPGGQSEFVFAVVSNRGQGVATNVALSATYATVDSANPNRDAVVTKEHLTPILEPQTEIALCVFVARVPTANDEVRLISASITASDIYRDGVGDPPQMTNITPADHQTEQDPQHTIGLR